MILETLTEYKVLNYGNFKSKTNTPLYFYLDENEFIGNHTFLNLFSKLINKKINHLQFDALMATDLIASCLCSTLGGSYNHNVLHMNNQKILGSRRHKKIILLFFKTVSTNEEIYKHLISLGFIIEKVIIVFGHTPPVVRASTPLDYVPDILLPYEVIKNYKNIAHFQGNNFNNEITQRLANNIVLSKTNKFNYYGLKTDILHPCVYFTEKNINLLNSFTDSKILKLYFKVFNNTQLDFFTELSPILNKIDIIIIHLGKASDLMKIVKKIKRKIGIIIYFEKDDFTTDDLFNLVYFNYKEWIIGTLNKHTCNYNIINFNKYVEFLK